MSKKVIKGLRIALSGATIDGRTIEAKWLTQAAKNYSPEVYTARINCDHYSGWGLDKDGRFGSFGTILGLSTETLKDSGKVALLADVELNERGVAAIKADQKVFSSIEVWPEFADTGEAYVSGLAMTDTPASLGTQRMSFTTLPADATCSARPFTEAAKAAKADQVHAFALAHPLDLNADDEGEGEDDTAANGWRAGFTAWRAGLAARFAKRDKATQDMAAEVKQSLDDFGDLTANRFAESDTAHDALQAAHTQLAADFEQLKSRLEKTEAGTQRPASIGGTGQTQYMPAPY